MSELIERIDFVLDEYGTGIAPEFYDIQALSNCLKDCRAELERLEKEKSELCSAYSAAKIDLDRSVNTLLKFLNGLSDVMSEKHLTRYINRMEWLCENVTELHISEMEQEKALEILRRHR